MTAPHEPAGERPPRIFFLHIPKTGGLTLRELIRRQYGRGGTYIPPPNEGHPRRQAYLRWLEAGEEPPPGRIALKENPQLRRLAALPPDRVARVRAIMGHLWFGVHEALPGPFTYLTMLRDPLDRALSTYHHRVTRHGLAMSVEEYVRSERDTRIDNGQTRRLATTDRQSARRGPVTPAMYESAVNNLREHFAVVGLTDRFDLSVLLMARAFGWRRLGYVPYNVSRGRPRIEDLPPDVVHILRRHNEYDLELLKVARGMFEAQVAASGLDPERDVAAYRRGLRRYQRVRPAYEAVRAGTSGLRRRVRRRAALRRRGRRHL